MGWRDDVGGAVRSWVGFHQADRNQPEQKTQTHTFHVFLYASTSTHTHTHTEGEREWGRGNPPAVFSSLWCKSGWVHSVSEEESNTLSFPAPRLTATCYTEQGGKPLYVNSKVKPHLTLTEANWSVTKVMWEHALCLLVRNVCEWGWHIQKRKKLLCWDS